MIQLPFYVWIGFGIGTFTSIASSLMACWLTYIRSNRKFITAANRSTILLFAIFYHLYKIVAFSLISILPVDILVSRSFIAPFNTMMLYLVFSIPTIAMFWGFRTTTHLVTRRLISIKNLYSILLAHSVLCWSVFGLNMALYNGEQLWEIYYGMAYVSFFCLAWVPTAGVIDLYFCKDY